MRTKDITDCFEIGWLAGFSITIRNISANVRRSWTYGNDNSSPAGGQGPIRHRRVLVGWARDMPIRGAQPPSPGVAEKRAPARHGGSVYFSAI